MQSNHDACILDGTNTNTRSLLQYYILQKIRNRHFFNNSSTAKRKTERYQHKMEHIINFYIIHCAWSFISIWLGGHITLQQKKELMCQQCQLLRIKQLQTTTLPTSLMLMNYQYYYYFVDMLFFDGTLIDEKKQHEQNNYTLYYYTLLNYTTNYIHVLTLSLLIVNQNQNLYFHQFL